LKRTTAGLVSAVATLVLAAVGVSGAAAGNTPSSYTNATWYSKYQVVASGAVDPSPAPTCTTPIFEGNVDGSHETGSQSETFIAIDPSNGSHVVTGENEIQRLPMRANYSFERRHDVLRSRPSASAAADAALASTSAPTRRSRST